MNIEYFDSPKQLGAYFKKLRKEKRLTLKKAAHKIGCKSGYLYALEIGEIWNPRLRTLKDSCPDTSIWEKLCCLYGTPYDHIVQNSYLANRDTVLFKPAEIIK